MVLHPNLCKWTILVGYCLFLTIGCAVHYYEEDTGIEHIWGFGHMKMKASKPSEELQAVVHGTDVLGVSIGKADKHGYFTVGWQRLEFIDVLKESTSIRLEWPDNTFGNVRVGSKFPFDRNELGNTQMEKTP
jgi:hypothetical protein